MSAVISDAERAARIKAVVLEAGEAMRARHPILQHQDALGMAILLLSLAAMSGCAALYLQGLLPWWLCLPLIAISASFTHELEHDLIHLLYFRKHKWTQNFMMLAVWLARPSTVNPWLRRRLHFNHHKHSGTEVDLEERAITNGERWGLGRLVMTMDNTLAIVLRLHRAPTQRLKLRMLVRGFIGYFPLGIAFWALWYCFLGFHLANGAAQLLGNTIAWSTDTLRFMSVLNPLTVVLIAPNVLRTFCLHFISSNMHYYGDVEHDNVIQQCQVLTARRFWPLQAFCFNFGASHGIHHFVVNQPFYLRQLVVPQAHVVMREMGVRFNDFGSFARANRRLPLDSSAT